MLQIRVCIRAFHGLHLDTSFLHCWLTGSNLEETERGGCSRRTCMTILGNLLFDPNPTWLPFKSAMWTVNISIPSSLCSCRCSKHQICPPDFLMSLFGRI
ncbi:UNVERIFIED_CONTAM: hypothetical protein K2H54_059308 [Gekko kuhli]